MATQKQAKATEKVICEFCGNGFSPYGIGSHKKACQKRQENERVDQQVVEKELRDREAKEEGAWLFMLPNSVLIFDSIVELLALGQCTLAKAMTAPTHPSMWNWYVFWF